MSLFSRKPAPPPQPPAQPQPASRTHQAAAPKLSPAQVRVINWEEEMERESLPAPRRTTTYTPAASELIQMPRVNLASPDAALTANITPPSVIEAKTIGSYQDRARAWIKYAMPLSLTLAAVSTIAAVAFQAVPLLSFWSLLIFGLTFVGAYALLLRKYWQHTPEGVALENVRELWGYYEREQAHRHAIERQAWDDQRAITRKGGRQ